MRPYEARYRERVKAAAEARLARHRERHERATMSTTQLDTAQGLVQLTKRGPDWWEVRGAASGRFLGVVIRWHNHPSAPWEPLLPLGSHERGIELECPRFATMDSAVLALAATYGRSWQSWPEEKTAGFEA